MWKYQNTDELYHYGIIGMKWGVAHRRNQLAKAKLKLAKSKYKNSVNNAFDKYSNNITKVESGYKRGQNLSRKDIYREGVIEDNYNKSVAKSKIALKAAKRQYKIDKKNKSNDLNIANQLYSKQSKEANKRIVNTSTGKAVLESMLLGSAGALKYNESKAKGNSTAKSIGKGALYQMGNNASLGAVANVKYLKNRKARKK